MRSRTRVSYAVISILSAHAAMVRSAETAEEAADRANDIPALSEIIVTATRRAENVRDVPIAIQAFTPDTLRDLNVSTLDDAIKYLPNVTMSSVGPGQSNIYMRGLAASSTQLQAAGYAGTFPNVAVYLDDQSGQLPGRNLDVYAADLERIEVLEGPQGTLFGAGAQAGVVRYITNKPKLNVYEANFNAGYGITAGGDPNTNIDATVNLPLIDDRLAVRAVFYNDKRGGYIDNRRATFERLATDQVVPLYFNGVLPPNSGPINNYNTARDNFNPVTYQGVRGSALLKINDDWNALLVQSYQTIDSDGVFWEEQYDATGKTLPPLSVELFNPN